MSKIRFLPNLSRNAVATTWSQEGDPARIGKTSRKDGYYDSPGLPIFREWLKVASQIIFSPSIGDWWWIQGAEAGLPVKYDYFQDRERDAVLMQTIRTAVDSLKARYTGPSGACRYSGPRTRRGSSQRRV